MQSARTRNIRNPYKKVKNTVAIKYFNLEYVLIMKHKETEPMFHQRNHFTKYLYIVYYRLQGFVSD